MRSCAREAERRGASLEIPVFIPRLSLSTDNAAMIAAAGMRQLDRGAIAPAEPERLAVARAVTPQFT